MSDAGGGRVLDSEPGSAEVPPQRRKGSRSMPDVRMSRGSLWGFLTIAFLVGIAIGVGLLLWQRSTLMAETRALERKITAAESKAASAEQQVEDLTGRLDTAEASVTDLTEQNSQLASDLASAKASAESTKSKTATGTVKVKERTISPSSVSASGTITMTAKVQGRADKVWMRVTGPGGYAKFFTLSRTSTSGGVDTWKRTVNAPDRKGKYNYYANAYLGSKKFDMPGAAASSFTVR